MQNVFAKMFLLISVHLLILKLCGNIKILQNEWEICLTLYCQGEGVTHFHTHFFTHARMTRKRMTEKELLHLHTHAERVEQHE